MTGTDQSGILEGSGAEAGTSVITPSRRHDAESAGTLGSHAGNGTKRGDDRDDLEARS